MWVVDWIDGWFDYDGVLLLLVVVDILWYGDVLLVVDLLVVNLCFFGVLMIGDGLWFVD